MLVSGKIVFNNHLLGKILGDHSMGEKEKAQVSAVSTSHSQIRHWPALIKTLTLLFFFNLSFVAYSNTTFPILCQAEKFTKLRTKIWGIM